MDKNVRHKIEYAFYNYDKLRDSSAKELVDLAYKDIAVSYDKPAVQSSGGKTMQDKICALIDKTSENYRWAMVVEKTIEHFAWDCKKQLIIEKYFKKENRYKIAQNIGMSDRTFDYWLEDILTLAYRWAIELGVMENKKEVKNEKLF
jgi:hypothetical protein